MCCVHALLILLYSLIRAEGARLMSNKEIKLPPKSEVITKKNYQEVLIPPPRPVFKEGEREMKVCYFAKSPPSPDLSANSHYTGYRAA